MCQCTRDMSDEKQNQKIKFVQHIKSYILILETSCVHDRCENYFQMFHYIDETFDMWYNTHFSNAIKSSLQMGIDYNNQPRHYIDYYLNLQCKFGFKNYCAATTKKNLRCRHNKHTGMYCKLHHNINIKRKRYLNKFINKDVSNIIITYL